ncbi:MAG: hypothetical protein LBN07_00685 [Christensenellaceae bacterium]|nr:hypothetical protein [Christensenellaceae bacterium]
MKYKCEHCGINYTKAELNKSKDNVAEHTEEEEIGEIEFADFEEEYFDNCIIFDFRPYNTHTEK